MRQLNAGYLTVMLEGRYTDGSSRRRAPTPRRFTDEEMAVVGSPLDFVGINIYQVGQLRAGRRTTRRAGEALPPAPTHPHAARLAPDHARRRCTGEPRLLHRCGT